MSNEYDGTAVNFQTFPKSMATPTIVKSLIDIVKFHHPKITSEMFQLSSNDVLSCLRADIENLGFEVERGKGASEKVKVPVLYGLNGSTAKTFDADGFHRKLGIVLEVEAGRAVANYQFLKDLFQACAMQEANHLVIAVRNVYGSSKDFNSVITFLETLYASSRLVLPLTSVTILGY